MNLRSLAFAAVFLAPLSVVFAPEDDAAAAFRPTHAFDFRFGDQLFAGGFADYPEGEEAFYELAYGLAPLPDDLAGGVTALRITGNNHSDDLFMFVKRQMTGLEPSTGYRLRFIVKIASNAPKGALGIGGALGEAVTVKAGATTAEPVARAVEGFVEMNVDKGNQANGGADASVLGHIAVSNTKDGTRHRFKTLRSRTLSARTDADGKLWILVGTDSGFEGTTTLYYARIAARVKKAPR